MFPSGELGAMVSLVRSFFFGELFGDGRLDVDGEDVFDFDVDWGRVVAGG